MSIRSVSHYIGSTPVSQTTRPQTARTRLLTSVLQMWEVRTHVRDCSEISVSSNENSPVIPTERPERLTTDEPRDISARLAAIYYK